MVSNKIDVISFFVYGNKINIKIKYQIGYLINKFKLDYIQLMELNLQHQIMENGLLIYNLKKIVVLNNILEQILENINFNLIML